MAPEVLGLLTDNNNKITYGCASDVYSFGVCCWEIATGGYPFDEFNDHPKYQGKSALIKEGITFAHLRPTLLPPAPDGDESKLIEGVNTPQLFIDLIQQCWQFDPTKRPTFNTIIYILSDLLSLDPNTQIPSPSLIQNNQNFDFSTLAEFNRASCRVSIDFVPLGLFLPFSFFAFYPHSLPPSSFFSFVLKWLFSLPCPPFFVLSPSSPFPPPSLFSFFLPFSHLPSFPSSSPMPPLPPSCPYPLLRLASSLAPPCFNLKY